MKDSFRYFPVTSAQQAWGLYVTCAGRHTIRTGDVFPPTGHPDEYYFTWERGRTLSEWQMILLEHGTGEIEFTHLRATLADGSLIVLPPGVWHRYGIFKCEMGKIKIEMGNWANQATAAR